jgi:hypothetical protein
MPLALLALCPTHDSVRPTGDERMTNFQNLKVLIMSSGIDDFLIDNDSNVAVMSAELKISIKANLDLAQTNDVSRFLTMVLCYLDNDEIDDEMVNWTQEQYTQYLSDIDMSNDDDLKFIDEFLSNF